MATRYQPRAANAPDYRVIVGSDVITPAIRPRLVSLEITDSRCGEADELTLVLEDSDGQMQIPATGVVVSVAIGWQATGLVDRGEYTIDEVEHSGAPDQIHIRGRSADMRDSLPEKRTRSWDAINIGEIIDIIAGRHQLTPAVAERLARIAIDHIDQTDESDLNFITRLGDRYDAIAAIKSGRLLFAPAGRGTSASGIAMPTITLTRADGDTHRYRQTDRDTYTGVIAYWRDENAAKRQRVTARTEDRAKTLRDTYPTQSEAQDAATAELKRLTRGERSLSLTLARGRPDLVPETAATVAGYKQEIGAIDWIVTSVQHRLNDSSYTNSLELEVSGQQTLTDN